MNLELNLLTQHAVL